MPNYIELNFLNAVDSTVQAAFTEGVAFWNNAIIAGHEGFTVENSVSLKEECGLDVSLEAGETLQGLRIYAGSKTVDGMGGALAQAGACLYNDEFPLVGVVSLDNADISKLAENGNLVDVVKHEIAHVLGFGTQWLQRSFINNFCTDRLGFCDRRPTYNRANARDGFLQIGGLSSEDIPVENLLGGNTHWKESFFGNELMTSSLDLGMPNPVSQMTIRSFIDLGYRVNLNAAEEYLIPSQFTPFGVEKLPFFNDILAFAGRDIKALISERIQREEEVVVEEEDLNSEFGGLFGFTIVGFIAVAGMIYYLDSRRRVQFEKFVQEVKAAAPSGLRGTKNAFYKEP